MSEASTSAEASRANLAVGLGVAALGSWVVAMLATGDGDENGWLWFVMAAFSIAALVMGLRAGGGRPRGRVLAATVIGGLLTVLFLAFVIADAVS